MIQLDTWSSLLVCRRRCVRKSRREHFLTRMRSVVPSARWAEGDRPFGLRGHAQLILAAFIAMNFPRIVLQPPTETEELEQDHAYSSFSCDCFCSTYKTPLFLYLLSKVSIFNIFHISLNATAMQKNT